MATIKEIADYVGVSSGTVSRVLNHDSTISVSDETKMKIFDAAEQLQYKTIKQRKSESKENAALDDLDQFIRNNSGLGLL